MVLEEGGTRISPELLFSWEEGQKLISFPIHGRTNQYFPSFSTSASSLDLEVLVTRIQPLVDNAEVNIQSTVMELLLLAKLSSAFHYHCALILNTL